jgi:hypothetical protein
MSKANFTWSAISNSFYQRLGRRLECSRKCSKTRNHLNYLGKENFMSI